METNNKSILKEALSDYNEILETASNNAKIKLAEEFSTKYNQLLNKEIKNKLNNGEESISIDKIEESVTDNIVTDNAETNKNSNMKKTKETKKVVVNESFDVDNSMSDENVVGAGTALENKEDDTITIDDIEKEISEMEELENQLDGAEDLDDNDVETEEVEDPISELIELQGKLQDVIDSLSADSNGDDENSEVDTEIEVDGDINEDEDLITDEDIDAILNSEENDEVEESRGVSYAQRRNASGRNIPGDEYLSSTELDQAPYIQENKSKLNNLLEENKKLTKKVNTLNKENKNVKDLLESYKSALNKYRTQLQEMAVFNTNLAHVNNILVNEELALTQNDKIGVINQFKNVKSINESQETYKTAISGLKKNNKKNLIESIEDKVVAEQPSKQIIEKTAYEDNQHLNKMKRINEYVENRGKKIIK